MKKALKLDLIKIRGLHSNFGVCESFLHSNSPSIVALFDKNIKNLINSRNFAVTGYLPLIRKDCE